MEVKIRKRDQKLLKIDSEIKKYRINALEKDRDFKAREYSKT